MIIQHWASLIGNWSSPNRSLVKAAKTVRQHALNLAVVLGDLPRLEEALTILGRCLAAGCRINKSVKTPRTFQILLALNEEISLLDTYGGGDVHPLTGHSYPRIVR
ncbi:MAG: hypothetical protein GY805_33610 [Chloroflexi bacterium]|nr:hypothetical protein [Chloroflexota bacterium]